MIRGIHYFSAEVKPKLMSSQGAALRTACILTHPGKNRMHEKTVLEAILLCR